MLKYFKIKNFKSIVEETFDFTYNEKKCPSKEYLENSENIVFLNSNNKNNDIKNKNRFSPVNGFWGANASGKSNIILSFLYFKKIVLYGCVKDDNNKIFLFEPNKEHPELKNTYFEISFIINNEEYIYSIEYNSNTITKEEFKVVDKIIYSIDNLKIKENNLEFNEENKTYIKDGLYKQSCLKDNNQIYTFIKKFYNEKPELNKEIKTFIETIINKLLFLPNNKRFLIENVIFRQDTKTKNDINKITKLLKDFDININKIEYNEVERKYYSYHKDINGNEIKFDVLEEESDGTKILLHLFDDLITCLNDGKILIIDELDESLHSLVIIAIVKMFKSKYYNKNNSQLIFTCHNTDLLDDLLRRTEINLINKTKENGTKVYRLSNNKKIRNVINFKKQYLEYKYSCVPFIGV